MNRIIIAIVALLVAGALLRTSMFIVDQRHAVIVFSFGQIERVLVEPGLYFKWPLIQNIETVDQRILTIDSAAPDPVQTSEKKNVLIDTFVKWKVVDAKSYWISFQGNERAAEERMSSLVRGALNQAVNKRTVSDIVSRERDKAMEEIRAGVQEQVKDLGVKIVDVRLRHVDFVPEILSESVYPRMSAERKRVANEQRSTGGAEAERIKADADRQREVLIAEAYRDAQRIKGDGDAKAAAIYARAYSASPEFYAFYRSLEAYKQSFKSRSDTLVLDPSSEFFRFFKNSGGAGAPH